jgi:hypothetical protein
MHVCMHTHVHKYIPIYLEFKSGVGCGMQEHWVGEAAGSAPAGFKAEYIAPAAADNYYALSPAARAQAILNSNPAIVPGAVAFPGRGVRPRVTCGG